MIQSLWSQLLSFMGRGGPELWVILGLLVLIWVLLVERLLYLAITFNVEERVLLARSSTLKVIAR
jgi:biopolymer transport protein ExbB